MDLRLANPGPTALTPAAVAAERRTCPAETTGATGHRPTEEERVDPAETVALAPADDDSVEGGVVVGVDGTATGLRAAAWAAAEARARGVALRIVHAAPYAVDPAGRARAGAVLARARGLVQQGDADLDVRTGLLDASPTDALIGAGDRAGLLVLGMIGDRIGEVVLGSIAPAVAGGARCPVAVVRGLRHAPDAARATVLGIAGPGELDSPSGPAAVAFADARRHGSRLRVVHAAHRPHPDTDQAVRASLDAWSERFPSVPVDLVEAHGRPADALLHASGSARVVVVGSHGRGAAARAVLGSTSREVMRSAHCPVIVVPQPGGNP
jgi:nucleotide-binding universal stress UspA family protein